MKSFLIIIDLQKGFINEGANDYVVPRIDKLLELDVFDTVISTVYKNHEKSPLTLLMGWNKFMTEEEQALVGRAADDSDITVCKYKYSAYSDELLKILKEQNGNELPECVYLAGVDTECCVLATAIDFFEAGIRPIVLSYYSAASSGKEAELAGLRALKSLIGKNNISSEEITSKDDIRRILSLAKSSAYNS